MDDSWMIHKKKTVLNLPETMITVLNHDELRIIAWLMDDEWMKH